MRWTLRAIAIILVGAIASEGFAKLLGVNRAVAGYVADIGVITYISLSVASAGLIVVDLVRRGRAGDGFAWALCTFAVSIIAVPLYLIWTHLQDSNTN